MNEWLSEWWSEIVARPSGPMAVRFYLQPLTAALLALRDGIKDARTGRAPYFWAMITGGSARRELFRLGWRSIGKVFTIAWTLDIVYQLTVLKGLRPFEALFIAAILAIVPYLLIRGPANRIASRLKQAKSRPHPPLGA
jgi:hypothetical protein